LRELRPERELLQRELFEVDIGNAQSSQLGAEIDGFKAPILTERFLQRQIPLLRVAASVITLHPEHALPQTRVGVGILRLDGWPSREDKGRIDVVEGLLSQRLNEWKQRRRKR